MPVNGNGNPCKNCARVADSMAASSGKPVETVSAEVYCGYCDKGFESADILGAHVQLRHVVEPTATDAVTRVAEVETIGAPVLLTSDRWPITNGMAVWDYNLVPGRVELDTIDSDGWFYVNTINGRSLMNNVRVCVRHPYTGVTAAEYMSNGETVDEPTGDAEAPVEVTEVDPITEAVWLATDTNADLGEAGARSAIVATVARIHHMSRVHVSQRSILGAPKGVIGACILAGMIMTFDECLSVTSEGSSILADTDRVAAYLYFNPRPYRSTGRKVKNTGASRKQNRGGHR